MSQQVPNVSRRTFITGTTSATAAVAAGSLVTNADLEQVNAQVNTNSGPTALRITDMRIAHSDRSMLMRLDTNRGISGYGEIRYDCSKAHGLILKSRIIGMNPCNVAEIFRKIKKEGGFGCAGGGVSAIEVACWDLAGKAWGVPVWQMLGGKFRDKILIYADTTSSSNAEQMAKHLLERIPQGFKFLKMDLNITEIGGGSNVVRPAPMTATGLPGMPRTPH